MKYCGPTMKPKAQQCAYEKVWEYRPDGRGRWRRCLKKVLPPETLCDLHREPRRYGVYFWGETK